MARTPTTTRPGSSSRGGGGSGFSLGPGASANVGGSSRLGRGASWATGFALLFLFFTLLALIIVPARLEEGPGEVQEGIQNVLEPAERLAAQVELAQVRQKEAYQAFLLSGDARSRQRYREARLDEESVSDTLRSLAETMSGDVREQVYNLLLVSLNWHLGHTEMLSQEVFPPDSIESPPPSDFREILMADQAAYDDVRSAGRGLRESLAVEMRGGELAMARAREFQDRFTRILVGLGLIATALVLFLAWHLRKLMIESEERRQEAIRARREADAILQATGDGVLGMDREARCLFVNRAGAELLGYPTRLVAGRDVHDLLHHSHADGTPYVREECPVLMALSRGEAISGRAETLWRAGKEPFPVHLSLRPLKDGPILKGAVLSFTDMTETRAAEESLRQAVRARDEVLAVVSHDLRNPVGTVFSAASLLLELELAPEKQREHLHVVKRSASRMSRLIQDLLDVARMEAGALPVDGGPLELGLLVDEVLQGQRSRAEEAGVQLGGEVQGRDEGAWGDRDRVVRVLTNLVENALNVTPSGGEVVVGVMKESPANEFHFWVSDTGPGIPPGDRSRLFDRFWQVSRRDKGGAGLGLSIVKGLVEAHGGRVWVETVEGEGTTFWFSLPGAPEKEP